MFRVTAVIALLLLTGCGSCLDDEKSIDEPKPPIVVTTLKTSDSGGKHPIIVVDSVRLSDVMKRDGGPAREK